MRMGEVFCLRYREKKDVVGEEQSPKRSSCPPQVARRWLNTRHNQFWAQPALVGWFGFAQSLWRWRTSGRNVSLGLVCSACICRCRSVAVRARASAFARRFVLTEISREVFGNDILGGPQAGRYFFGGTRFTVFRSPLVVGGNSNIMAVMFRRQRFYDTD